MENLLLLTDFSEAAFHAARYAAALTHQYHPRELVLCHAYPVAIPTVETPLVADANRSLYEDSMTGLLRWQERLKGYVYSGTSIRCRAEAGDIADCVNDIAVEERATLIVMGLTGESKFERMLSGREVFTVPDESNTPVLLVPENAEMAPLERIVFAFDAHPEAGSMPVVGLAKILDALNALLLVVNVGQSDNHFPNDIPAAGGVSVNKSALHGLLANYHPSYHHLDGGDVEKGILEFTKLHKGSVILTIRKDHGFFQELFHHSVTHHLAQQASVPLLVLHEAGDR